MLLLPYRPIVASLPPDNAAAYAPVTTTALHEPTNALDQPTPSTGGLNSAARRRLVPHTGLWCCRPQTGFAVAIVHPSYPRPLPVAAAV